MQVHELSRACGDSPHEAEVLVFDGKLHDVAAVTRGPNALILQLAPANVQEGGSGSGQSEGCAALNVTIPYRPALRTIDTHKGNAINEAIAIEVLDGPGPGGASHVYRIGVHSEIPKNTCSIMRKDTVIEFQNGPIKEVGVNGLTQEVLLAIVIDRLESFQYVRRPDGTLDRDAKGPFNCKSNEDALGLIKGGLTCLLNRTKARIEQGVEGTHDKHVEPPTAPAPVDEHPGKLRLDGRPFPVPPEEQGYRYFPKDAYRASVGIETLDLEWFDTDNGQWWSTTNSLIDWESVGAFRRPIPPAPVTPTGADQLAREIAAEAQPPTTPEVPEVPPVGKDV